MELQRDVLLLDPRRGRSTPRAGASSHAAKAEAFDWHAHPQHQLLMPLDGVLQVETEGGMVVLPRRQAAWIPAGSPHRTTFREARSASVFFEPAMFADAPQVLRVLFVSDLMRELAVYAMRWPIGGDATDSLGEAYFDLLALLCGEWIEAAAPLRLPTSADPALARVIDYTNDNLASVTVQAAARAGGLSERSLRRRFHSRLGMSWEHYRLTSRLSRAMAMLASGDASVTRVAAEVGFETGGAFAKAFRRFTGETPRAYRVRLASGGSTRPAPLAGKML
jgi:AraC-like DNA-binding protein